MIMNRITLLLELLLLQACIAQLARPDKINIGCLQKPHIVDLIFSQKSPDNRLTTNIGYRKLDFETENQEEATQRRSYMYVYAENAPNRIILSDELFDHYSYDYGTPIVGYWIKTPWSLLKKCKNVNSVAELLVLYATYYQSRLNLPALKVDKYQSLVRSPELNNIWYDYEYFNLPQNQVEYEIGRVLRKVIEPTMPQRVIDNIVFRIKECKFKANIFRFGSPFKFMKTMYSQSFRILLVACHDPKNIQILAFNSKKTGFYITPDTTRTEKLIVKKVLKVWLQNYFINMFASQPQADQSEL